MVQKRPAQGGTERPFRCLESFGFQTCQFFWWYWNRSRKKKYQIRFQNLLASKKVSESNDLVCCFSSIGCYLRQLNIFLIEVSVDISLINNSETFRQKSINRFIFIRGNYIHALIIIISMDLCNYHQWHSTFVVGEKNLQCFLSI